MNAFLSGQVAIVTGAGRGLGRGMALGLARRGATVIGPAHIASDFDDLNAVDALPGCILPVHADLRRSTDCDAVVKAAEDAGGVHMLVNNAGLTLTYICPDLYRRPTPPKFWEASDEVVQNVMDANYVAADKLARRVAPNMVKQGWGRIINVTTMLATMSRVGFSPYGPSKAALEMATWVWAKELEHSGVTANIVNPGAGANTPGMAEEIRHKSREGSIDRLVEPEEMVPPLLWVVSREADKVNGMRYDAKQWDASLPPAEAARRCGRPAGFALREPSEPPSGPIIAVAVALWEPQSPEAFWAGGMIGNRSAELLGSFAPPSAMPTSSIVLQNLSTHVANNWLRPLIVTRARAGCSL